MAEEPPIPPVGFWSAIGVIIAGVATAAVSWFRAGKTEGRRETVLAHKLERAARRDAVAEVWGIHDRLLKRFDEQQVRSDENRDKIEQLSTRLDDCESKHEACEEQHKAALARIDSLEDSVKQINPNP